MIVVILVIIIMIVVMVIVGIIITKLFAGIMDKIRRVFLSPKLVLDPVSRPGSATA